MQIELGHPLILDFAAAALASPAQVSGKGHQFGRLRCYGFAVPDCMVLSTEAHRLVCSALADAEKFQQLA